MRFPYNKINVDDATKKSIRSMFFCQEEMKNIKVKTNLTERVVRRIIKENLWIIKRNRYLRYLAHYASRHGISLIKISKQTGIKYCALCRVRKENKIAHPEKKSWNSRRTKEIESQFVNEYNCGLTAKKIAEKYGFKTNKTVLDVLKKHNVEKREPKIQTRYNEKFFEKINSKESAYFLGLIVTDGYIIKDYNGFRLQLSFPDEYILNILSKLIGSTNGINKINMLARRENNPNVKDMYRISVNNSKIARDLEALGVTKRKSKTLRFAINISKKYLSHFFRGLIDGDGTIGVHSKNGNIWCQLCSVSKGFLLDLKKIQLPFVFFY